MTAASSSDATTGWSSPTQTRFRQRDQVLIRLAEKLIQEQGMVSFRFSELASLAGCSAGTLYKHFSSKEDLLVAIFARHVELLVSCQPHLMNSDLSFAERWIAMHFCGVIASEGVAWSLALNALGGAPKMVDKASDYRVQELKMYVNQFYGAILRVVEAARIQGELTADDEQVRTVHTMMACFQRGAAGLLHNELMLDVVKPIGPEAVYEAFATLINGMEWKTPLTEDSFERILAEVNHQLGEMVQDEAIAATF